MILSEQVKSVYPPATTRQIHVRPFGLTEMPEGLPQSFLDDGHDWVLLPDRPKSHRQMRVFKYILEVDPPHGHWFRQSMAINTIYIAQYVELRLYMYETKGPCGRTTHYIAIGEHLPKVFWMPLEMEMQPWTEHDFYMRAEPAP